MTLIVIAAGEFEAMQDAIGTGSLDQAEMLGRLVSRVASLEAAVAESQSVRRELHNQLVNLRGNVSFLAGLKLSAILYFSKCFTRLSLVLPQYFNLPGFRSKTCRHIELRYSTPVLSPWLCYEVNLLLAFLELKMAILQIRVFCRVKPHPMPALICTSDGQGIKAEVDGKEQLFQFDRVFPAASSQQDVFNEVSELIQSALDGFQAGPHKPHSSPNSACHAEASLFSYVLC